MYPPGYPCYPGYPGHSCYPYYPRRWHGYYSYPYGQSYNFLNSQYSSINQSLYNAGYMNGVSQNAYVNQYGGFY